MRGYLKYLLRNSILRYIINSIVFLLVFLVLGIYVRGDTDTWGITTSLFLAASQLALFVISIITIIIELRFKTDNEKTTVLFSFPIKRKELYFAKCINGLISIILPYIVFIVIPLSISFLFNPRNQYPVLVPCNVILISSFYVATYFFVSRTHAVIDGILSIVLSIIFWYLVMSSIQVTFISYYKDWGTDSKEQLFYLYETLITLGIMALFTPLFFVKDTFEEPGQITKSFISIRLQAILIPIALAYYIPIYSAYTEQHLAVVIFAIASGIVGSYVCLSVASRTPAIGKRNVVYFLCGVAITISVYFIAKELFPVLYDGIIQSIL